MKFNNMLSVHSVNLVFISKEKTVKGVPVKTIKKVVSPAILSLPPNVFCVHQATSNPKQESVLRSLNLKRRQKSLMYS